MKKRSTYIVQAAVFIFFSWITTAGAYEDLSSIGQMIGKHDAILVKDKDGRVVLSKNADTKLIPASTLKVLTSLAALHYLGDTFRFRTEFYIDGEYNLIIKGFGDPLLVSEVISKAVTELKPVIIAHGTGINDILIDQSYFESVDIPGRSDGSYEPYNAPIGALSANFNTVNFFRDSTGAFVSAEEQTPIFPFLHNQIRRSGLSQGRIILNENQQDLYVGSLFKFFLEKQGITVKGNIVSSDMKKWTGKRIHTFESPFTIQDVVRKLLEYSNNYIANQLIVSVGARVHGTPGSLSKGLQAIRHFTEHQLGITDYMVVEGSGLSRRNRISAEDMWLVVSEFKPYRSLMKSRNNLLFKTGTLTGISTRVGFVSIKGEAAYSYVIFCNTSGKSAGKIENMLGAVLSRSSLSALK